ncbi:hypothetical protein COCCADRAFT_41333 [Bipolaris zeicola 26-R-13]|uniref:Rhodopsin domain-containing protein n=1 Tax=Cochliobolus carbonum (strain 26-R-13) TaxID=930089 RepID=W6XR65_COCC2|nr:uncharacterized protein COCCADRAFT_41333 [Bipolaris zeicola 26-R-13]EUC28098.1 hypothetical protein COCCADRAFT_41333 [Bipolaris zeicola 26-R-13]
MALKPGDPGYMDEDASPMLYAITFSCLGFALLIVILRLFSRLYLLKTTRLNLAEWLVVVSSFVAIASCVLIHFQIETGMGKHIEYSRARPKMLQASMKVGLAQNSVYQALVGLIKASMLAQLHLLAAPGMQKKIVFWTGCLVSIFTIFTTFGCWNMMAMNFFTSTVNTLLDFVIFFLPLPTLLNLKMERKKKVSLLFTYCAGSLAIACSIIRLRNMIYFRGVGDFTYQACMVPVWGAIECNAGIVCGSFPYIMPLIKRMSGSIIESMSMSRANPTSDQQPQGQNSNQLSWPLQSKRQSRWHQMDSESIEAITENNGWKELDDIKKSPHIVEHSVPIEHSPRVPTLPHDTV